MLTEQVVRLYLRGHTPFWISKKRQSPIYGQISEMRVIRCIIKELDLIHCKSCGLLIKRKAGPLCKECIRKGLGTVAKGTNGQSWCSHCQAWLPIANFSNSKANPSGCQAYCKTCDSKYKRERKARRKKN